MSKDVAAMDEMERLNTLVQLAEVAKPSRSLYFYRTPTGRYGITGPFPYFAPRTTFSDALYHAISGILPMVPPTTTVALNKYARTAQGAAA